LKSDGTVQLDQFTQGDLFDGPKFPRVDSVENFFGFGISKPVVEFKFPIFRCTQLIRHVLEPGTFDDWSLWDGEEYKFMGRLPDEYRSLEYLAGWASDALELRIATGENFFTQML
jgi:hypothetical protein